MKHEADALKREIVSLQESKDQDIASLQHESTFQRKLLLEKDSEIAAQRERIHSSEEEALVKAEEIAAMDALLQSKERMVNSLRKEADVLRHGQPTLVRNHCEILLAEADYHTHFMSQTHQFSITESQLRHNSEQTLLSIKA